MPLSTKADSGTAASSMRMTRIGNDRRLRMLRRAEREEHRRLRREQDAERGDELRERRGGAERPEDRELDDDGDEHDERRRRARPPAGCRRVKPSSPVRSAQNENPASMAIAPAARLMKPEPRYVTTMPTAMAAIVAPVPRPSRRKRRISFTSPREDHADGAGQSTGPVGWNRSLAPSAAERSDPAGRPLELELALVGERLEHVVADRPAPPCTCRTGASAPRARAAP